MKRRNCAVSMLKHFPGLSAIGVISGDPVTGKADIIYLFSYSLQKLMDVHRMLPRRGIQVVRFSRITAGM